MNRPTLTVNGLPATHAVSAMDEFGVFRPMQIAGENPLTIYLDRREIVTLMTLGTHPELLTLGYLKNQNLVSTLEQVRSVQVDWDVNAAAVTTSGEQADLDDRLAHRTITTGCGQGTIFGQVMDSLEQIRLPATSLKQSTIYALLKRLADFNDVYRSAGAVHGCALCRDDEVIKFIEDVGRHNAVDAIAGWMWLEGIEGRDKTFYTTGRLTSEMVIKVAQMEIPVLLSRSGITTMGLDLAHKVGVTLIARAKGRHFLVFSGADSVLFDAVPPRPTAPVQV